MIWGEGISGLMKLSGSMLSKEMSLLRTEWLFDLCNTLLESVTKGGNRPKLAFLLSNLPIKDVCLQLLNGKIVLVKLLSDPLVSQVPLVILFLPLYWNRWRLFDNSQHHLVVLVVYCFFLQLPSHFHVAQALRCERWRDLAYQGGLWFVLLQQISGLLMQLQVFFANLSRFKKAFLKSHNIMAVTASFWVFERWLMSSILLKRLLLVRWTSIRRSYSLNIWALRLLLLVRITISSCRISISCNFFCFLTSRSFRIWSSFFKWTSNELQHLRTKSLLIPFKLVHSVIARRQESFHYLKIYN